MEEILTQSNFKIICNKCNYEANITIKWIYPGTYADDEMGHHNVYLICSHCKEKLNIVDYD